MKWFNCGARAVTNYDIDVETDADKVFYRYAYFEAFPFKKKNKAVVFGEVDMGSQRYFSIRLQLGGDALLGFSTKIWNLGFEFAIWGYR